MDMEPPLPRSVQSNPKRDPNPMEAAKPPTESTLDVCGWRFTTRHAGAMNSSEREALAHDALQLPVSIPLPEMVFAQNAMELQRLSPTDRHLKIRFQAEPALKLWASSAHHAGAHWDHTRFDFTYRSNYRGSVEKWEGDGDEATLQEVVVEPTTERLPLDKLMQHVKILYYDHVLLFEDDVRDLGEIYLEAKVRVMEFGFLVLCRYYCRVDGKSVQLIDTRYYHEFGQEFIWRDHEIRQASVSDLRHRLYPHVGITTDDAHFRQLDFSADAIYPVLEPTEIATEKIYIDR